jgi:hypothetical protein
MMIAARPALLASMRQERAEAEAWLAADWTPDRRWVICNDEWLQITLDEVVKHLAEETSGWSGQHIGFVDDVHYARRERMRQRYSPEHESHAQTAWIVPEATASERAWQTHLATFLRPALEQALATFPREHAGHEIKDALTGGYDEDQVGNALEELWEGTGPTGLTEGAQEYLELRYYREDWSADVDPSSPWFERWHRSGLLPASIVAILDAVKAHDERESA